MYGRYTHPSRFGLLTYSELYLSRIMNYPTFKFKAAVTCSVASLIAVWDWWPDMNCMKLVRRRASLC
eukprot:scaffold53888_cov38-Tisochrysis_lutea.AAC.3